MTSPNRHGSLRSPHNTTNFGQFVNDGGAIAGNAFNSTIIGQKHEHYYNSDRGASVKQASIECLRSLYFPQQNHRELDIEYATGTCKWLLEHVKFRAWIRESSALLWIRGKPGSGKSNLMKYAVDNFSANNPEAVVASFFLDGRGVTLQKSALGMYRALLYQLIPHFSDDLSIIVQKFRDNKALKGRFGKDWNWMEVELRDFFTSLLPKACAKAPAVLFIDALDEAGEDQAIDMAERLNKILRSAEELGSSLRICVSCRHYPNIAFDTSQSIIVEDENSGDISLLVKEKLDMIPRLKSGERWFLEHELIEKGSGIFQWITVILQEAKKMKLRGQGIGALQALFRKGPANLDAVYEYVLRDYTNRRETIRLFQWILFAMEPVSLKELRSSLPLTGDLANCDLSDYPTSDFYETDIDEFRDFIGYLSKGLVEIKLHDNRSVVQFVHQTVPDYLLEQGLQALEDSPQGSARGRGHFQLARSCMHYLLIKEVRLASRTSSHRPPHTFIKSLPLVAYAWRFWRFHVIEAEIEGMDQSDLVAIASSIEDISVLVPKCEASTALSFYELEKFTARFFPTPALEYRHDPLTTSLEVAWALWPSQGETMLHFLCLAGIRSAVLEIIRCNDPLLQFKSGVRTPLIRAIQGRSEELFLELVGTANFNIQELSDEEKEEMVWWAAGRGWEKALKLLLESGARIAWINEMKTPILLAAEWGYANIVRILISAGADLDWGNFNGENPLRLAAGGAHDEVVRLLLEEGADVNDECPYGTDTPLSFAVREGHLSTTRILLEAGARVDVLTSNNWPMTVEAVADDTVQIVDHRLIHLLLGAEDGQKAPKTTLASLAGCRALEDRRAGAMRKFYISCPADLEAKDTYGATALAISAHEGYLKEMRQLLAWGADPNSTDFENRTPLAYAIVADDFESCQMLLEDSRTDPEARNIRGRTPLVYGVLGRREYVDWHGWEYHDDDEGEMVGGSELEEKGEGEYGKENEQKKDILEYLLQTGRFDINARDSTGWSPLALAVQDQNLEKTKILLGNSTIDPIIRDRWGRTPLMHAAKAGNLRLVQLLLKHEKVEPNLLDKCGKSALYYAVRSGSAEVVRILLQTGQVHARSKLDCFGMTPLLWAILHDDIVMVSLLLETEEFCAKAIETADKEARRRLQRGRRHTCGDGRGIYSVRRYWHLKPLPWQSSGK